MDRFLLMFFIFALVVPFGVGQDFAGSTPTIGGITAPTEFDGRICIEEKCGDISGRVGDLRQECKGSLPADSTWLDEEPSREDATDKALLEWVEGAPAECTDLKNALKDLWTCVCKRCDGEDAIEVLFPPPTTPPPSPIAIVAPTPFPTKYDPCDNVDPDGPPPPRGVVPCSERTKSPSRSPTVYPTVVPTGYPTTKSPTPLRFSAPTTRLCSELDPPTPSGNGGVNPPSSPPSRIAKPPSSPPSRTCVREKCADFSSSVTKLRQECTDDWINEEPLSGLEGAEDATAEAMIEWVEGAPVECVDLKNALKDLWKCVCENCPEAAPEGLCSLLNSPTPPPNDDGDTDDSPCTDDLTPLPSQIYGLGCASLIQQYGCDGPIQGLSTSAQIVKNFCKKSCDMCSDPDDVGDNPDDTTGNGDVKPPSSPPTKDTGVSTPTIGDITAPIDGNNAEEDLNNLSQNAASTMKSVSVMTAGMSAFAMISFAM